MTLGHRSLMTLVATTATAAALTVPVTSAVAGTDSSSANPPPASVALPDGFQPEGIAIEGRFGYFGSRADGDIYRADLRSGEGLVISQGPGTGFPSVGLKVGPRDRIYVSGGTAGTIRIVDARTGDLLTSLPLNTGTAFINDVVLTKDAAWFTDSRAAQLYRVPIFRNGRIPTLADVQTLPLTGEWVQPPAGSNGANGITETPDGEALLVVNGTAGTLYRVPTTGAEAGMAELVDLGGASVSNGDGLLLEGTTLYVVRNRLNVVDILTLDEDGDTGRVTGSFTSPAFDVPTTIARWRDAFYLPNARFTTPPTPTTTYAVTRVERG